MLDDLKGPASRKKELLLILLGVLIGLFFTQTRIFIPSHTKTDALIFHDCSNRRSHTATEQSPFWNEPSRFMNQSKRAKRGVKILLEHTQPSGLIVDMGAGFHALERYLPEGTSYRPVDLVQRVDGIPTSICNLNRHQFPFFEGEHIAAYFFLGSFEYVLDKVSVLRLCRMRQAAVVLMYRLSTIKEREDFQWVAPFSLLSFKETAEIVGYRLRAFDMDGSRLDGKKTFEGKALIYLEPV